MHQNQTIFGRAINIFDILTERRNDRPTEWSIELLSEANNGRFAGFVQFSYWRCGINCIKKWRFSISAKCLFLVIQHWTIWVKSDQSWTVPHHIWRHIYFWAFVCDSIIWAITVNPAPVIKIVVRVYCLKHFTAEGQKIKFARYAIICVTTVPGYPNPATSEFPRTVRWNRQIVRRIIVRHRIIVWLEVQITIGQSQYSEMIYIYKETHNMWDSPND